MDLRHRRARGSEHGTRGIQLDRGWRYDLEVWLVDTFLLGRGIRKLRRRVLNLADVASGQAVLDVGCGTGSLAIEAAARVGAGGLVAGIDPASRQVARAKAKARRKGLAIEFRVGVIEAIPFPDRSFEAVTSTLMMHHLPEDLRGQGISEAFRVLKPGGRLVVADFKNSHGGEGTAEYGSQDGGIDHLTKLIEGAGFIRIMVEELGFRRRHRGFAGAFFVLGHKP